MSSKRDFLSLKDTEIDKITDLLQLAHKLKAEQKSNKHRTTLRHKTLFMIFYNKSLRTRNSFECAMNQLGGHAIYLDSNNIYTPVMADGNIPFSTESIKDVANVLSSMGDAISLRIFGEPTGWVFGKGNQIVKEFSKHSKVPVINMECDRYHPCQALADLFTISEIFKKKDKPTICISWAYSPYVMKPISVPQDLLVGSLKYGLNVILAHPKGFELENEVIDYSRVLAENNNVHFDVSNNLNNSLEQADIIYAKAWTSAGLLSNNCSVNIFDEMKSMFDHHRSWKITEEKMKLCRPGAKYMHCMPIDRNHEADDDVIDSQYSLIYRQAENRLHVQKAVLLDLLEPIPNPA